ncbi:MAG TPA: hypothetical protein VNG51_01080 [Ktedonobacteraceae bacterium]|nr:hypothetical protein [Ktedonobacteraceae bacterium]
MNNDGIGLPASLEFNNAGPAYAWVQRTDLAKTLSNLQQYFLAPEAVKNDDGTFTVVGYSFVHLSHLPTKEGMDKKYGEGNW